MKTQKSFAQRQARVRRPERFQVEMHLKCLDEMLPREHRCRIVWKFVGGMDLDPFYAEIRVSDSQSGRTAIAPEVLFALWLLATLDGVSSARELGRRCETDMPYLWICGGVSVNYHTLSDFRVQHGDKLGEEKVSGLFFSLGQLVTLPKCLAQNALTKRMRFTML